MAKPHIAPVIQRFRIVRYGTKSAFFQFSGGSRGLAIGGPEATRPADVEINFGAEECRVIAFLADGRVVHFDDLLLRQRLLEESFAVLREIGDRPLVEAREPVHNLQVAPKL